MPATEIDVLESRLTRIEAELDRLQGRISALERSPRPTPAAATAYEEEPATSFFDFALVGRSVLIVGGGYLLRALTELGFVPQRTGVYLAFLYAIVWIAIADRNLGRGRRTVALFDASTAAIITASLIWEATTRFHSFTPSTAAALVVIVALAFLIASVHRRTTGLAWIGAAMTAFTTVGLTIGTADALPPAIAAAIIGIVSLRLHIDSFITPLLTILSDFLLLVLIAMTAIRRSPHSLTLVELTLIGIAIAWTIAIERGTQWPVSVQTTAVLLIGGGGASLFALTATPLVVLWSLLATITAAIGRRYERRQWTIQAPLWAGGAMFAAFASEPRIGMLLLVGVAAVVTLLLIPRAARLSRLILLTTVTVIALACADALIVGAPASIVAMERSILLAVVAVVLSLLSATLPEARIVAFLVLLFGAGKFLVEDLRGGQAITLFAALAAYGTALVIIARRRAPQIITKETV